MADRAKSIKAEPDLRAALWRVHESPDHPAELDDHRQSCGLITNGHTLRSQR